MDSLEERAQSGFSKLMCKYINVGGFDYTISTLSGGAACKLLINPKTRLESVVGCACAAIAVTFAVIGLFHTYTYIFMDKDKRSKYRGLYGSFTGDANLFDKK